MVGEGGVGGVTRKSINLSHSAAFMRHGAGLSLLLDSVISPGSARTLAVFPCAAPKAFKGGNTNICVTCQAAVWETILQLLQAANHSSVCPFIHPFIRKLLQESVSVTELRSCEVTCAAAAAALSCSKVPVFFLDGLDFCNLHLCGILRVFFFGLLNYFHM